MSVQNGNTTRRRHVPVNKPGFEGCYWSTVAKSSKYPQGRAYEARCPRTKRYVVAGGKLEDAKALRTRLVSQNITRSVTGNPNTKIETLVPKWREFKSATVDEDSMVTYERVVRNHIEPRWGKVAVNDVQAMAVTSWLTRVPEGTRNLARTTFAAIMNVAVAEGMTPVNVVKGATLPRVEKVVGEVEDEKYVPTLDELDTFISRCPARLRPAVEVKFAMALRLGEVVGLDWSQIDFEKRTLNVDRQLTATGKVKPPKHGIVRRINLDADAYPLLRDMWMLAGQPAEGSVFGLTYRSFEESFRRVVKGIEFGGRVTPHTLRHAKISYLVAAGFDVASVSNFARHSSIKVTMEYYIHLTTDAARDEAMRGTSLSNLRRAA